MHVQYLKNTFISGCQARLNFCSCQIRSASVLCVLASLVEIVVLQGLPVIAPSLSIAL